MSTAQRRRPTSVIERLFQEPHRFEFFQAVRHLDGWFARAEKGGRRQASSQPLSDRIRFRNSLSLAFPPSEVAEFRVVDSRHAGRAALNESEAGPDERDIDAVELTPAFMGLLGAGGALPVYYTELFAHRELYQRDPAARAFMDIFQHRAVALFYQAWRKHRLAIQFEVDRRNHFLPLMLAIAGVGQLPLRQRLMAERGGVADDTLAYFAGTLQHRPVSAAAIGRVLSDYFNVRVRVEQFIGRWFTLPVENQSSLGIANAGLGRGAVASERVWQRDLRLRLTFGPMPREKFRRFLPGGAAALALRELLHLLAGVTLEYEVRLALRAADIQPAQLDSRAGPLLGWDAFLVSQASTHDRSDAGYDLLAA